MRLVAGRTFDRTRRDEVREALIDSALARQFFPDGNALGAKIPFGDGSLTVVGVFEQVRMYEVHRDGRRQILTRAEDWGYRPLFYVVRTRRDPRALIPEARAAVRRIDPRVAVGDERTMDEIVTDTLRQEGTSAALISAFALGALLLAGMGLFAVVSGSVTQRHVAGDQHPFQHFTRRSFLAHVEKSGGFSVDADISCGNQHDASTGERRRLR